MLQSELEVLLVFFRERWNADVGARQVDALVLSQGSTVQHLAYHLASVDSLYHQLNAPVGKEYALPRLHIAGEALVSSGDHAGRSHHIFGSDGDPLSIPQYDRDARLQASSSDLWPLQILQDADGAAKFAGHLAQSPDNPRMFLMGGMGEVQPRDIHSTQQQLANHFFAIAGRPHCANDLGSPARGSGTVQGIFEAINRAFYSVVHDSGSLDLFLLGIDIGMRSKEETRIA